MSSIKSALRANAIFSGVSGLVFLAMSTYVSDFIGLDNKWIVFFVGLGLILFSITVFIESVFMVRSF